MVPLRRAVLRWMRGSWGAILSGAILDSIFKDLGEGRGVNG